MTASLPAPSNDDQPPACPHPWFVVTCGECGASLDEVRHHLVEDPGPIDPIEPAEGSDADSLAARAPAPSGSQSVFIVARGQTELLDQLRALLGESGSIRVIEDRRRAPRAAGEMEAQRVRTELRRRVREEGDEPAS